MWFACTSIQRDLAAVAFLVAPTITFSIAPAEADNKRLNDSVVANVYTVQHQAGCTTDLKVDPRLRLAAQWHAEDLLNNHYLADNSGSDGSSPQQRANAAGFTGTATETVAISPALAISGLDIIRQWYDDPESLATMRDCNNTAIGVWSLNSIDRSVVVAVYGKRS